MQNPDDRKTTEAALAAALADNRRLEAQLRTALDDLTALTGLLPICAYCKRVRDRAGDWQQIEAYISAHTHVRFSHSVCPTCLRVHYPEAVD